MGFCCQTCSLALQLHSKQHIRTYTATGIIWVECQVSLGAGETVMSKVRFEEWLWKMAAAEIKHLHSDNGVFTADMFRDDCKMKHQSQVSPV